MASSLPGTVTTAFQLQSRHSRSLAAAVANCGIGCVQDGFSTNSNESTLDHLAVAAHCMLGPSPAGCIEETWVKRAQCIGLSRGTRFFFQAISATASARNLQQAALSRPAGKAVSPEPVGWVAQSLRSEAMPLASIRTGGGLKWNQASFIFCGDPRCLNGHGRRETVGLAKGARY